MFDNNKISSYFNSNTVVNHFSNNESLDDFSSNIIGGEFNNNKNHGTFNSNTMVDDFQLNEIKTNIYNIDFTSSTHVYNSYNCTIIKGSDTNNYITYFDGTINVYAAITA
jgi:hypothetical protein